MGTVLTIVMVLSASVGYMSIMYAMWVILASTFDEDFDEGVLNKRIMISFFVAMLSIFPLAVSVGLMEVLS